MVVQDLCNFIFMYLNTSRDDLRCHALKMSTSFDWVMTIVLVRGKKIKCYFRSLFPNFELLHLILCNAQTLSVPYMCVILSRV